MKWLQNILTLFFGHPTFPGSVLNVGKNFVCDDRHIVTQTGTTEMSLNRVWLSKMYYI